jgi:hypothetical protein
MNRRMMNNGYDQLQYMVEIIVNLVLEGMRQPLQYNGLYPVVIN